MRYIIYSLLYSFLLLGCADKDAFSKFGLQEDQSRAVDNVVFGSIKENDKLVGVVGSIYLNTIYPKKFYNEEKFYIVTTISTKKINFFLNDSPAVLVEQLPVNNPYTHLLELDASWMHYYLVSFETQPSTKLSLEFRIGDSNTTKGVAVFEKSF